MAYVIVLSTLILILLLACISEGSKYGEPKHSKDEADDVVKSGSVPCDYNKDLNNMCNQLADTPEQKMIFARTSLHLIRRRRSNQNQRQPIALPRRSGIIDVGRRRRRCSWFRRITGRC